MTVDISRGRNPRRDPEDRRLQRIAGPSALVIFGVTGDRETTSDLDAFVAGIDEGFRRLLVAAVEAPRVE